MPNLEHIFHPRSIAVVGASPNPLNAVTRLFLDPLLHFGFEGELYPIHPTASEVSGLKTYPSILDVPGPVDHVICGIRADLTPNLMKECTAKKVNSIQLFTASFSESGEMKGIRLEKEIAEIARQGNVRVLGPNCMGIYCPGSRMSYEPFFPRESGNIGCFCQSGGNSIEIIQFGSVRNAHFSKVVSYGNACDIDEVELLEYFTDDPQTEIITGYIEGTKNGRRLAQALHKATEVKPVIMLKGGVTKAGTKAAASHTGSLAGNAVIWDSVLHQSGVTQVYDMEELIDLALLFQHLKPVSGKQVALVGGGGGSSVLITDICEQEGLLVPSFPDELKRKLREIIPVEADPGTSVRNPVDTSSSGPYPGIISATLETIDNYAGVDFTLFFSGLYPGAEDMVANQINSIIAIKERLNKPIIVVIRYDQVPESGNIALALQQTCTQAGIPVFRSFDRAARTISRFVRYYEDRDNGKKPTKHG